MTRIRISIIKFRMLFHLSIFVFSFTKLTIWHCKAFNNEQISSENEFCFEKNEEVVFLFCDTCCSSYSNKKVYAVKNKTVFANLYEDFN